MNKTLPGTDVLSARDDDLPQKSRAELFALEDHYLERKPASQPVAEMWMEMGLLTFHQEWTDSDGKIVIPARYGLTDLGQARLRELQMKYWRANLTFTDAYEVLNNEIIVPPGGCSVVAWMKNVAPGSSSPIVAKPARRREDMYLPPEVIVTSTPDGHIMLSSDGRSEYTVTLTPANGGLICTAIIEGMRTHMVPWGHGQAGLALSL